MNAKKDNGNTEGKVRSITFPSDGYIVARGTFETCTYYTYNANHEELVSVSMN